MRAILLLVLYFLALPSFAQNTPLDSETLTARELIRLPLLSAPARTSAHLAPDGERFMHVRGTTFCLYALIGLQIGCSDMVEQGVTDNRGLNIDADSIAWSPDGQYLAFTTDVWTMLRDSDIWVLDVSSGRFHNMTDDGYDGRIGFGDGIPERTTIDTSPVWMPDGRLSFIRHAAILSESAPSVWTIAATGGMPEKIIDLVPDMEYPSIITGMDWSPDGSTLAYIVDSRDNPQAGVWIYEAEFAEIRPLYTKSEAINYIMRVTYSPDGGSILVLTSNRDSARFQSSTEDAGPAYFVIGAESGEPTALVTESLAISAGWLPDGGLIYVGRGQEDFEGGGLFVTADPETLGRKVLDFPTVDGDVLQFFAPTGRQAVPLFVSPNGRLLLATPTEVTLSVELSSE